MIAIYPCSQQQRHHRLIQDKQHTPGQFHPFVRETTLHFHPGSIDLPVVPDAEGLRGGQQYNQQNY